MRLKNNNICPDRLGNLLFPDPVAETGRLKPVSVGRSDPGDPGRTPSPAIAVAALDFFGVADSDAVGFRGRQTDVPHRLDGPPDGDRA